MYMCDTHQVPGIFAHRHLQARPRHQPLQGKRQARGGPAPEPQPEAARQAAVRGEGEEREGHQAGRRQGLSHEDRRIDPTTCCWQEHWMQRPCQEDQQACQDHHQDRLEVQSPKVSSKSKASKSKSKPEPKTTTKTKTKASKAPAPLRPMGQYADGTTRFIEERKKRRIQDSSSEDEGPDLPNHPF